jgi:hypothetical protein
MTWRTNWRGTNPVVSFSTPERQVKIAIVLHIFYEDYVDRFCRYISEIDFPIDVFVTTPNAQIAKLAEGRLNRTQNVNKVEVAVVPNRGRNFAPLLVEFGKELLKYDIFGHFHSKKSLFTGKEQVAWADYLFDTLLDPARCKYHVHLLADQDKNVGLVYPTTPPTMSFTANHWLRNEDPAKNLETITNLKVSHFGFVTFPIGGMFWARSRALAPLLGANWSYHMFPEEAGQVDGTLQHAIERFISTACEASGFKKVAFHPELNSAFEDDSYVFAEYLDSLQIIHSGYLTEVEHLSVNLFDSLISRVNAFDDYQKVKACQKMGITDSVAYLELRNSTERELRKSLHSEEVSMTQIAELMSRKMRDLHSMKVSPTEIMEAEICSELDVVRLKHPLGNIVKKRQTYKKSTTIVMDTCYERGHIERMLTEVGISLEFIDLKVSSETRLRKDDYSYWANLAASSEFSRENYVHVGNNVVSDYHLPLQFDFQAVYLPSARDLAWMLGRNISNDFAVVSDEFAQNRLKLYQDPIFTIETIPRIGDRSRKRSW